MTYASLVRMFCFKHTDMLSKTLDEIAKTLDEIIKTLDEITKILEKELLFLRICNVVGTWTSQFRLYVCTDRDELDPYKKWGKINKS